ncbi:MAG: class I SAM-dependent methyltransferase [Rhodocyclaceae bacterium]|nr:class I SAM-dependent methyltransferase [Rhodocyclaceae bacterium]
MTLRSIVVGQFRRPHGLLGSLAGLVMARRPSNLERNAWTVGLMAAQPWHRILEIGCGPGVALEAAAAIVSGGQAVGIDHSETMVRQARRRLAAQIASGSAVVRPGSLGELAGQAAGYDRVFSVNVVQFLPDLEEAFEQIHGCLADQGIAATTFQPRSRNPTRDEALDMAQRIAMAMRQAGFSGIARHELTLDPAPAICVTGIRHHTNIAH